VLFAEKIDIYFENYIKLKNTVRAEMHISYR